MVTKHSGSQSGLSSSVLLGLTVVLQIVNTSYGNLMPQNVDSRSPSILLPSAAIDEVHCEECLLLTHSFDQLLAELSFNISCINKENPCCKICTIGQVSLFTYDGPKNASSCMELLNSFSVLKMVTCIMKNKVSQPEVMQFPNTGTGCYTLRFRPSINPIPIYHGFFWLHTHVNIVHVNQWNTTFYLNPNYQMKTLEVTWQLPVNSYNFTNFGLQLWHHKNNRINCDGENAFGQQVEVIPKNGNIVLRKPSYRFTNLSHGWYCARLTPLDDRCGNLGCQPLASPIMFFESTNITHAEVIYRNTWQFYPLWLVVVSFIVVAIFIVSSMQYRRQHHYKVIDLHKGSTYNKVVSEASLNQQVLVLWTQAGPDGAMLEPMVKAFKSILQQKAHCQPLDYLDLLSLPLESQKELLANPVHWVDSILSTKSIKVVIVASKGAHWHQQHYPSSTTNNYSKQDHNENDISVYSPTNSLDRLLFPYIIGRLKELPELSYDYSRVFHIRFPSICSEECDLEGVVPWARYSIPEHYNDLIFRLHGIPGAISSVTPEEILPS